ncbi:MAG: ORF6N domain-containing protein [Bacteroidales bacterium]|nr:ORF6N domain-containing protein [Bacteroidales bacterium]
MERFPEDFLFQLTKEECLRSQFVTLNMEQGTHLKYMPYAFTELGVAMLSSSQIPKNKRNQLPENNSQFIMHNSQLITHNS